MALHSFFQVKKMLIFYFKKEDFTGILNKRKLIIWIAPKAQVR